MLVDIDYFISKFYGIIVTHLQLKIMNVWYNLVLNYELKFFTSTTDVSNIFEIFFCYYILLIISVIILLS